MVFAGSRSACRAQSFLGRRFRRNPRRAFRDCLCDLARSVQSGVEIFFDVLRFGGQRNRAIAQQQSFRALFFDEMILDIHRTLGAMSRSERRASYLENKYDTPIVNAGLFNQAVRDCRDVKIVELSGAVR